MVKMNFSDIQNNRKMVEMHRDIELYISSYINISEKCNHINVC